MAFFVTGMYFISIELVKSAQVTCFSWLHFTLLLPFVPLQLKTVQVMGILKRKILYAH